MTIMFGENETFLRPLKTIVFTFLLLVFFWLSVANFSHYNFHLSVTCCCSFEGNKNVYEHNKTHAFDVLSDVRMTRALSMCEILHMSNPHTTLQERRKNDCHLRRTLSLLIYVIGTLAIM